MSDSVYLKKWLVREPPHFVKNFGDLTKFYQIIRDKYQAHIDEAFDAASAKIGFVGTTILPVTMVIDQKGKTVTLEFSEDSLKTSVFNDYLGSVLTNITQGASSLNLKPGTYNLLLFWQAGIQAISNTGTARASAESVTTAASCQQPQKQIPSEAAVLLSAIDKVYPELNLGRRITDQYVTIDWNAVWNHQLWKEPAHFQIPSVVDVIGYQGAQ